MNNEYEQHFPPPPAEQEPPQPQIQGSVPQQGLPKPENPLDQNVPFQPPFTDPQAQYSQNSQYAPGGQAAPNAQAPQMQSSYQQVPYGASPQMPGMPMGYVQQKSKLAAGLLGIFLGGLGIHNFYLGRVGRGLTQLLISLFSIGFLAPLVAIWGIIEGILYLASDSPRWNQDARGIPLR